MTKFTHGAWIVVVLIPTLVVAFVTVRRHYDQVARQLSIDGAGAEEPPLTAHTVLVLVGDVHRGVLRALRYARALSENARGVYVEITPEQTRRVEERWGRFAGGMPLVVLRSPYRSVAGPLLEYLDHLQRPGAGPARHDHPAGVHPGPLVAAPAPQPDGAPDQGRAALPERRHRHERALPPRAVGPAMSVQNVKRILLGTPIPTAHAAHERLGPLTGLAIFASDALSSVAYATEEILLILVLAGSVALGLSVPIAVAIGDPDRHRRQLLPADDPRVPPGRRRPTSSPARTSAGIRASSPGAALLVDYVLTVAVSVAAGIAAITSAIRPLYPYRVTLCIVGVILIAVGNLRGVRESGRLFALPTYLFLGAYVAADRLGGRPVVPRGDRRSRARRRRRPAGARR